jgi:hypothetical protein
VPGAERLECQRARDEKCHGLILARAQRSLFCEPRERKRESVSAINFSPSLVVGHNTQQRRSSTIPTPKDVCNFLFEWNVANL